MPNCGGFVGSIQNSTTNVNAYIPFFTGKQTLGVDAIGFCAAAAATPTTGQYEGAIYECVDYPSDLYPGARLAVSGTITIAAGGLTTATFTEVSLDPYTMYWFATRRVRQASNTASTGIMGVRNVFPVQPYMDFASDAAFMFRAQKWLTGSAATFADPAPSGLATNANVETVAIPFFRISSVS